MYTAAQGSGLHNMMSTGEPIRLTATVALTSKRLLDVIVLHGSQPARDVGIQMENRALDSLPPCFMFYASAIFYISTRVESY